MTYYKSLARVAYKSIAYSFPTSPNAEALGMEDSGAWHIEITLIGIEGSDQTRTFMPHNAEGYESPDDADLVAQFLEIDLDAGPHFKLFGNARAWAAIAKAQKEELA